VSCLPLCADRASADERLLRAHHAEFVSFRFWRDAGYALGALIGGITAALASLDAAIVVAAALTAASGFLAWALMRETHPD